MYLHNEIKNIFFQIISLRALYKVNSFFQNIIKYNHII
jgi:hypothetical protein